jgi:hypothetical protein
MQLRRSTIVASLLAGLGLSGSTAAQDPQDGLILFTPLVQTPTYLIDNNGALLHTWPSAYKPGKAVYMMENGHIMRAIDTTTPASLGLGAIGGRGGGFQELDWNGNLVWDYRVDDANYLAHHDFRVLPNGNVLILAWEHRTQAEAIAAGRDPAHVTNFEWLPESIIEVQKTGPTTGTVVWQWNTWDHLIQEFDPTKANYGVVADNPQLIDINYPYYDIANGDWLHANSLDYNAELDQIAINLREIDEFWIIDHSTTTAEAAGHTGGNSGMGGDILYRWGNPEAYQAGTSADRQFHGPHDVLWIPEGRPGAGNITFFNNGRNRPEGSFSTVEEIVTTVDSAGNYPLPSPGVAHGPAAPTWIYTAPVPTDFYGAFISGAERQENGNTLICSGPQGWFFEVDPADNLVWEYYNLLPFGVKDNVFKVRRYQRYLFPESETLSVGTGGTIDFNLQATTDYIGSNYLLLAGLSGTIPGTPLSTGITVPLNIDALTNVIMSSANDETFTGFAGLLDATGSGFARLNVANPLPASLIGLTMDFAFVVTSTLDFASDPMPITFVP